LCNQVVITAICCFVGFRLLTECVARWIIC